MAVLAERGVLQRLQRGQAPARGRQLLALLIQLRLLRALSLVRRRHRRLASVQHRSKSGYRFLFGRQRFAQRAEFVGAAARRQHRGFGIEDLAAFQRLVHLLVEVVDARALDLGGTRRIRGGARQRVGARMPVGERALGGGERIGAFGGRVDECLQTRFLALQRLLQQHALLAVQPQLFVEVTTLGAGVEQFALQARDGVAAESQLLLDARDLGADLVMLGLDRAEGLGGGLLLRARGLAFDFVAGVLGGQLLDQQFSLLQLAEFGGQLFGQRTPAECLGLRVDLALLGAQLAPALGLPGLPAQVLELLVDLVGDVLQALQVLARGAHPRLGLTPPLLVLGDAGCLLEVHAQVVRRRLDDLRDHALLDDRVRTRPEAGTEEQVGDVAPATLGAVQPVLREAVAANHATHRDFVVSRVLTEHAGVGVVEDQLHGRLPDRLALGGAVEDHVGHRVAAQAARGGFAEHPLDRIDDVRLAAPVRADDRGHVGRQVQGRRIDEGLEPGQFDGGEAHLGSWSQGGCSRAGGATGSASIAKPCPWLAPPCRTRRRRPCLVGPDPGALRWTPC
ncbi:MAG: hypothetical protein OMOMHJEC_00446 [Xanthomonadales bacterium]|nr:hypothetical protein [Xanthomonadales bacterium]